MDDPFLDDSHAAARQAPQEDMDEQMSRSIESSSIEAPAPIPVRAPRPEARTEERGNVRALREALAAKHICPFCGSPNPVPAAGSPGVACPRCTMEDSAATRQATKARIGPWHVLQTRNPAAPGMRYATLLALVGKSQVTARSIVRGPTTQQLWRWAGHVRGLSREFGMCYSCGQAIDRTATNCPNCDRSQEPPANPDAFLESRDPRAANGTVTPGRSAPLAIADDLLTPDPYASRSLAITSASHAERLRSTGDYRPVDTRIETRSDLANSSRRRPDGRILSSMELAAALQVTPVEPPPSSAHPVRTTILTILIFGLLATVVLAYARPDLRRDAAGWIQQSWQPVQDRLNGVAERSPKPDNAQPSETVVDSPSPAADVTPPMTSSDVAPTLGSSTGNAAAPQPSVTSPMPIAPNPAPSARAPAPADSATAPPLQSNPVTPSTPTIAPIPVPAPENNGENNVAAADAREHPSMEQEPATLHGSNSTTKEIWALRNSALDAEGRADWATAVKLYEQIESAPPDSWPADTRIRLANARRQLAAK